MSEACVTCRFWEASTADRDVDSRRCRRYPTSDPPWTRGSEWCGEWQRKAGDGDVVDGSAEHLKGIVDDMLNSEMYALRRAKSDLDEAHLRIVQLEKVIESHEQDQAGPCRHPFHDVTRQLDGALYCYRCGWTSEPLPDGTGRQVERAAVVKWLRGHKDWLRGHKDILRDTADSIEAGEHRE